MSALLSGYLRNAAVEEVHENKEQSIDSVVGHLPPNDRPHTRCNNNNNNKLLQVGIGCNRRFGVINAMSLRNKSLFVCNYVDKCSVDIVALTETWLSDEDSIFVPELCRDNFTLVRQPRGGARCDGGVGVLFRRTLQLVSRVTVDTRASETLAVTLRNCITRVLLMCRPLNSCLGTFLDNVSKLLLIAGTQPT